MLPFHLRRARVVVFVVVGCLALLVMRMIAGCLQIILAKKYQQLQVEAISSAGCLHILS